MKIRKAVLFVLVMLICFGVSSSAVLANADLVSQKYNLISEGNYIKGLPDKVNPEEFLQTISSKAEIHQSVDFIGTGTEITISENVYFFVVSGDVDGNGMVDSTDYLRIKGHFLGTFDLTDIAFLAGEVTSDGDIDSTDYLRIKGHFSGAFDLFENSYLPGEDIYTEPTFVVDDINAASGSDSVEVCVKIVNNPGILGMVLSVSYDDTALSLVNYENGEALSDLVLQKPAKYQNGSNFVWYGSEISNIMDGNVIKLVFNVSESAKSGEYPIEISYTDGDIYDTSYSSVKVNVINGSIVK